MHDFKYEKIKIVFENELKTTKLSLSLSFHRYS